MLEVKNRAYQHRIEGAIFEAAMRASMAEDGKTSVMLSGEIVPACLNTIAMVAGTSEVTATPSGARKFAEECARSIRRRSAEAREMKAAGGLRFVKVIHAGARH